jgi:hypothetical protein
MNKDSKLIELSCKEVLMNIVKESKSLDKKLSFFQKTLLFDKIKEMKYEKVIGLLFNKNGMEVTTEQKNEFESKTKKTAKYGTAAIGGGYVAKRVGDSIINKKLSNLKGLKDKLNATINFSQNASEVAKAKQNLAKVDNQIKELGKQTLKRTGKLTKFIPKYSKGASGRGVKGAIAAVAGLYLYRKLSDPCIRKNLGNKQAQIACKMEAIKRVISQIKSDIGKCSGASDPIKCRQKLSKELIKWQTKYQQYLVQLTHMKKKK